MIKTEIVKVPIQCKIPEVECITDGDNGIEKIGDILNCIYKHKEALKICQ